MSIEDIRHVYCDGEDCCESINGYNPHSKSVDAFMEKDLVKRGWLTISTEDQIGGYFCGFPLIITSGQMKHFCPACKLKLKAKK